MSKALRIRAIVRACDLSVGPRGVVGDFGRAPHIPRPLVQRGVDLGGSKPGAPPRWRRLSPQAWEGSFQEEVLTTSPLSATPQGPGRAPRQGPTAGFGPPPPNGGTNPAARTQNLGVYPTPSPKILVYTRPPRHVYTESPWAAASRPQRLTPATRLPARGARRCSFAPTPRPLGVGLGEARPWAPLLGRTPQPQGSLKRRICADLFLGCPRGCRAPSALPSSPRPFPASLPV